MPDIRIAQTLTPLAYEPRLDWAFNADGTIDETQALATAVIVAIGTYRLALPGDSLPDPLNNDRHGWWGDLDAAEIWGGWPVGTRLWEMTRDKITDQNARQGATVTKARSFIREAIQPFKDARIISGYTVEVTQTGLMSISAQVVLLRASEPAISLEFQDLWDEIAANSSPQP